MRPNLVLFFLVLLYISNQWARCSFPFLGNVALPSVCSSACKFEKPLFDSMINEYSVELVFSKTDTHKFKMPLCPSFDCGDDEICLKCQECLNDQEFDKISLSYGTCLSSYQYGFLSSYGYTIAFVVFTLIGSQIATSRGQVFRKYLVIATAIGWAVATLLQGIVETYIELFIVRVLLGAFEAVSTPFSYAIISELFRAEDLGRKNGLFTVGVYLGGALGSISIIFANLLGYRDTCFLIGGFSVFSALGLACTEAAHVEAGVDPLEELLLQESSESKSKKSRQNSGNKASSRMEDFRQDTTDTLNDSLVTREGEKLLSLWSDTTLWCLYVGAGLRLFGGFALAAYGPVFYGRRFPSQNIVYSSLNAIITMVFGAVSTYYGGVFSDRLTASHDERYRAYVPAVGCLSAFLPVIFMLFSSNFIFSIFCLGAQTVLSECWMAPAIAILQSRGGDNNKTGYTKERALSMYMFTTTLLGSLSPFIIGALDDGRSYESVQMSLFMTLGISYIGSALFFFVLGTKIRTPKLELM